MLFNSWGVEAGKREVPVSPTQGFEVFDSEPWVLNSKVNFQEQADGKKDTRTNPDKGNETQK